MVNGELTMSAPDEHDMGALEALLNNALHSPGMGDWMRLLGVHNFREVRLLGEVVAGFGYVPAGQWFGGVSVPSTGITAVGVAPNQRGSGVGSTMIRMMVEEMFDDGVPLSSLYPATLPFYQRAGYERAGQRVTYELALDAIDVREHGPEFVAVTEADYATLYALYERRARLSSGNLDRPAWIWKRKLESVEPGIYRYLIMQEGVAQGYVIYRQGERPSPITLLDVCVLTQQAGRAVLSLLARYRYMLENVTWAGGPHDPLVFLLREPLVGVTRPRVKTVISLDWMLRLIDVRKALSLRGYPPGLNAELHFDVRDDYLPANNGRIVLEIANGHGEVRDGGQGRMSLHVRDLASIYTGYMAPSELCTLGTLTAPDADLVMAASVFAAPRPWIADMF